MKQQRPYPIVTITKKGQRAIEAGHPWVYAGEVLACPEGIENGAIVDVCSEKGSWLGAGLISNHSLIRVRLLSRNPNDTFDDGFWFRRFQYAWAYRKSVLAPSDLSACRVVFGEADGFRALQRIGRYLFRNYASRARRAYRRSRNRDYVQKEDKGSDSLGYSRFSGSLLYFCGYRLRRRQCGM